MKRWLVDSSGWTCVTAHACTHGSGDTEALSSRQHPAYPTLDDDATVLWWPARCVIGLHTYEGQPRHAAPLIERKLRNEGVLEGTAKVFVLRVQTIGKLCHAFYMVASAEDWSQLRAWESAQDRQCLLVPVLHAAWCLKRHAQLVVIQGESEIVVMGTVHKKPIHLSAVLFSADAFELEEVLRSLAARLRDELRGLRDVESVQAVWLPWKVLSPRHGGEASRAEELDADRSGATSLAAVSPVHGENSDFASVAIGRHATASPMAEEAMRLVPLDERSPLDDASAKVTPHGVVSREALGSAPADGDTLAELLERQPAESVLVADHAGPRAHSTSGRDRQSLPRSHSVGQLGASAPSLSDETAAAAERAGRSQAGKLDRWVALFGELSGVKCSLLAAASDWHVGGGDLGPAASDRRLAANSFGRSMGALPMDAPSVQPGVSEAPPPGFLSGFVQLSEWQAARSAVNGGRARAAAMADAMTPMLALASAAVLLVSLGLTGGRLVQAHGLQVRADDLRAQALAQGGHAATEAGEHQLQQDAARELVFLEKLSQADSALDVLDAVVAIRQASLAADVRILGMRLDEASPEDSLAQGSAGKASANVNKGAGPSAPPGALLVDGRFVSQTSSDSRASAEFSRSLRANGYIAAPVDIKGAVASLSESSRLFSYRISRALKDR